VLRHAALVLDALGMSDGLHRGGQLGMCWCLEAPTWPSRGTGGGHLYDILQQRPRRADRREHFYPASMRRSRLAARRIPLRREDDGEPRKVAHVQFGPDRTVVRARMRKTTPASGRRHPTRMWSIWLCGRQAGQVGPMTVLRSGITLDDGPRFHVTGQHGVRTTSSAVAGAIRQLRCDPGAGGHVGARTETAGIDSESTTNAAR